MAKPPRSTAEKEASAPDSLPIGRAGPSDDDGSSHDNLKRDEGDPGKGGCLPGRELYLAHVE